jgi:tRNA(Arg) A34 adenosine deaminase TadA
MQLAIRQAETAVARGQTPFGAVVVGANGDIIGQGHNTVRANRDPSAHAEVVAIRDAWQHVGAWELLKSSTQIGVRRVVFAARGTDVPGYKPLLGADLAKAAAWVNAQPDWARIEVVGDFMRDQARDVIAAFPWPRAHSRDTLEPS